MCVCVCVCVCHRLSSTDTSLTSCRQRCLPHTSETVSAHTVVSTNVNARTVRHPAFVTRQYVFCCGAVHTRAYGNLWELSSGRVSHSGNHYRRAPLDLVRLRYSVLLCPMSLIADAYLGATVSCFVVLHAYSQTRTQEMMTVAVCYEDICIVLRCTVLCHVQTRT